MEELNEEAKQIQKMQQMKLRPSRARYDMAHATLDAKWRRRELKVDRMMREVIDVLWDNFAQSPYSWIGFYLISPDGSQLMLGPHRDKPACSPLPLHGVCGQVFKSGTGMIVPDVKALGAAHIECDPKNQSEIAVPVFNRDGKVFGVLDVDSFELNAFNEMDQRWLERLIKPFQDAGKPT